jgi:hypothetical protein
MNAGAQKESSPRLVGIVGGVPCIDWWTRDYRVGHGGYKTGYAPLEPWQVFGGGFLMLFVGLLLGSAV